VTVDGVSRTSQTLQRYVLPAILALATLAASLLLNPHLVPAGDNSTYLVLGQSLAMRSGYRMISDPRAPAMALYPPGYPLLVAVVLTVTGTTRDLAAAVLPMKLLSVVLHVVSAAVAYYIFRRRRPGAAAAVALIMSLNPLLLHFSNEVGTEAPFLLLSMVVVLLFERWEERPGAGRLL
jgi:Gpi18-like mannosyltransferase